jgi:AcrR family transcriptional regulator
VNLAGAPISEHVSVDEQHDSYRPLPTGAHGLAREEVMRDQRERLQRAMIELIAEKGYPAVRIVDLARLARVSQPTFYGLFADKEELLLSAYDEIAARAAALMGRSLTGDGSYEERLLGAIASMAELAAAEPDAVSLLLLGALGAGPEALEHRRLVLLALERSVGAEDGARAARSDGENLIPKALIGGVREVAVARLRERRGGELPSLAPQMSAWAASYPPTLPAGLGAPPVTRAPSGRTAAVAPSERARRAEGRLPRGRSELPRALIRNSQRERIVDATAAIVAEKGLAAATIPKIAQRASVSHQTFYDLYPSKQHAFLGAQKVGMHEALRVTAEAYAAHEPDWPAAVAAGLSALVEYLTSEPAHARLILVDTFAASPDGIEIRASALAAFAAYLKPGYRLATARGRAPKIAAEAIVGGLWQILRHYAEHRCTAELARATPQMIYFALAPFLGPEQAATAALARP